MKLFLCIFFLFFSIYLFLCIFCCCVCGLYACLSLESFLRSISEQQHCFALKILGSRKCFAIFIWQYAQLNNSCFLSLWLLLMEGRSFFIELNIYNFLLLSIYSCFCSTLESLSSIFIILWIILIVKIFIFQGFFIFPECSIFPSYLALWAQYFLSSPLH